MIGNSPIDLEGSFIDVNGTKYAKTHGLLKLLITTQATEIQITNSDMENYRKILEASSAYTTRYGSNEKIRPHNSNKFKYIIAPLFEYSEQGTGVLRRYKLARMNTSMDYMYWDDPNELVECLRFEQSAGNPSHVNEIHSIIEELREGGYIY